MIKKLQNQTFIDFIITNYQNLSNISDFFEDNNINNVNDYESQTKFENNNIESNVTVVTTYNLNNISPSNEAIINTFIPQNQNQLRSYYKYNNQNLLDFVMTNYNDLQSITDFIELNNFSNINDYDNKDMFKTPEKFNEVISTGAVNNVSPSNEAIVKKLNENNDSSKYRPYRKQRKQNLLDFIMTNYSDLNRITDFIEINKLNSVARYNSKSIESIFDVSNGQNTYFKENQIYVATEDHIIFPPAGSYNGDFNDDYFNDPF